MHSVCYLYSSMCHLITNYNVFYGILNDREYFCDKGVKRKEGRHVMQEFIGIRAESF